MPLKSDPRQLPPQRRRRQMRADEIEVRNPSGLHARPAALFVKAAARFVSKVTVQNVTTGASPADAKSILAVMGSGAAKGHTVRLTADGPDEEQAIAVLHDLFASGLGEELEA
jgi:phosphotransferase system HPr (HPr) family protein